LNRLLPTAVDTIALDEATYLLESGSNRLGAIDFQVAASQYVPRNESATLDDLVNAAELVQKGMPLPDHLERALLYGTAIGGARPKALLSHGGRQLIAKFSTSTDTYDVVGAEAASMYLARRGRIPVANSEVAYSMGRKVLLLDRFDRDVQGRRRMVVSGLTMLGLPETFVPLGTYPDLLDTLRVESVALAGLGGQIFRRVAFNISTSNTDDHLRNHAAFWDGTHLELTPAYDLSPVLRTGETGAQALGLNRAGDRRSDLQVLMESAADYNLDRSEAREIVEEVVDTIASEWDDAAEFAELSASDRRAMMSTLFLNPGSVRAVAPSTGISPRRTTTTEA